MSSGMDGNKLADELEELGWDGCPFSPGVAEERDTFTMGVTDLR